MGPPHRLRRYLPILPFIFPGIKNLFKAYLLTGGASQSETITASKEEEMHSREETAVVSSLAMGTSYSR